MTISQKYIDRFHTKYEKKNSGCWEWNAGKDGDGYGRFSIKDAGTFKLVFAHRFSWIIQNKSDWPIEKPIARHTCNNPCCVNPNHIIPGTHKENAKDCYDAGRESKNHHIGKQVNCPHCNKTGGLGVMKRWHFDNCKRNK